MLQVSGSRPSGMLHSVQGSTDRTASNNVEYRQGTGRLQTVAIPRKEGPECGGAFNRWYGQQ